MQICWEAHLPVLLIWWHILMYWHVGLLLEFHRCTVNLGLLLVWETFSFSIPHFVVLWRADFVFELQVTASKEIIERDFINWHGTTKRAHRVHQAKPGHSCWWRSCTSMLRQRGRAQHTVFANTCYDCVKAEPESNLGTVFCASCKMPSVSLAVSKGTTCPYPSPNCRPWSWCPGSSSYHHW